MNQERNNVLTASRMSCAMQCLRKHYWQCEVGLAKVQVGPALRIGSAWARGMEARWNKKSYDNALVEAIPEGIDLNEYDCAVVSSLLAAYYEVYGKKEVVGKLHPEVQFERELGFGFVTSGKIDGLGSLKDGRSVIIESKTTSSRLDAGSDYWLRLSFNLQVYQYTVEARHLRWDVAAIFYDVTRKPMIRPKAISSLDSKNLKIVLDAQGKRVMLKNGKPKQSASLKDGEKLKSHIETPDEYCDRVYHDALDRKDFYFARREIPVIDQQLEAFEHQRIAIAKLILSLRENEAELERPEDAWPRNVSENTCNFCHFKSFCLQNISPNINQPPAGFEVRGFNPELERIESKCESDQQSESAA